jgi:hypothetical protein
MSINYNWIPWFFNQVGIGQRDNSIPKRPQRLFVEIALVLLIILLGVIRVNAQTTLINPSGDGGFNNGTTFTANGWTVANEGNNDSKWEVGSAGSMSGTAAYISNDGGATNTYSSYAGRTVFFYRNVTVPAGQTAMKLTFNSKSGASYGAGWQVWAAPITQTITGSDNETTGSALNANATWEGATLISYNHAEQTTATATTAFIPASFAGTTFRLIFVWTINPWSEAVAPAMAIDNISLTSRTPLEISAATSGNWSAASTWDGGIVPTLADDVIIQANQTVTIDVKAAGAANVYIAGLNAILKFDPTYTIINSFTITNDLVISGLGAKFLVNSGSQGHSLIVGHNIDVVNNARLDISTGSYAAHDGALTLNGTEVQTINVDASSFFGGTSLTSQNNTNTSGVLNQLFVTNTSTAIPNVIWQVAKIRINNILNISSGKISLGTSKFIIGNYSSLNNVNCAAGSGFMPGTVSRWQNSNYYNIDNINPGQDFPAGFNDYSGVFYPFLSNSGQNRTAYFLSSDYPSTNGEVAITYTDSNSVTTGLNVNDNGYVINNRYNGKWTVTTPQSDGTGSGSIIFSTSGSLSFGVYANGGFEAKDATSRLMYANAAITGSTHQNGTTTPFVFRKNLTLAQLTAASLYVGIKGTAVADFSAPITSAQTGSWSATSTWVGGVVPTCSNAVVIANGHIVTVNSDSFAANVLVKLGGTLVNTLGTLKVGCTNNDAVFANYGTNTVSGGKVLVNGCVTHKNGSHFNQTGGDIIVDGNNNGDVATSAGTGSTLFKIETSLLNLTGGKITIVDPLVNYNPAVVTTPNSTGFSLPTFGETGIYEPWPSYYGATSGDTSIYSYAPAFVGQIITGGTIAPGTTVTGVLPGDWFNPPTILLSHPITGDMTGEETLYFSIMNNGGSGILLFDNGNANSLAVGQTVSGPGIQPGTTITDVFVDWDPSVPSKIGLSQPISGLSTSPITAPVTINIVISVSAGDNAIVVMDASNIKQGDIVTGSGIIPGTYVTEVNGSLVKLSEPTASGVPNALTMSYYRPNNASSGAFIYASDKDYVAGLNHTLQIGDGISIQKGAITTNGFNCQFQQGGGLLSLGNLTVNALDGANRFMNVSNNFINAGSLFNVQNTLTITSGSEFRKVQGNGSIFLGGSIINNGKFRTTQGGTSVIFGNYKKGQYSPAIKPTSLPQVISGSGTFTNDLWYLNELNVGAERYAALSTLAVNNTSTDGVSILVPNFRIIQSLTMDAGIIHTTTQSPILIGANADLSGYSSVSGNFGPTTYVDGPMSISTDKASSNTAQAKLFPLGKNGNYCPISMGAAGGVDMMAELFTTNTGTVNPLHAAHLSKNRWKLRRLDTLGTFDSFTIKMSNGSTPVNEDNLIVQASTDQGTYDTVLGATSFDPAPWDTNMPTILLEGDQPGTSFTGNFSYATCPTCPAPETPATPTVLAGTISVSNANVCEAKAATATAAEVTNTTTLTLNGNLGVITWYKSIDGGLKWAKTPGTTTTLTVLNLKVTTLFKVRSTVGTLYAETAPVAINVTLAATAGTITPSSDGIAKVSKVCMGNDLQFVSTKHKADVIQWQYSTDKINWTNVGTNAAVYSMYNVQGAANSKFYIRTVNYNGTCSQKESAAVMITISGPSVPGAISGGKPICSGTGGTLTLSGYVGTIQWMYSTNGGTTYTDVAAGTYPSFTTASTGKTGTLIATNVTATTLFKARVTNGVCSTTYSNEQAFTTGITSAAGTISGTATVCSGTGSTLTLSGAVGSIQWEKSPVVNGIPTNVWTAISGKTSTILATGNLTASAAYRAAVTICSPASHSNTFIVVVDKAAAKPLSQNVTTPSGASATLALCNTFNVAKTLTVGAGSFGTVTWERSSDGVNFHTISGSGNATTYTINQAMASAAGTLNYYRAKFTTSCDVMYSAAVKLYYKTCVVAKEETATLKPALKVVVYPNPYTENFKFDVTTSSEEKVGFAVYDMMGRLIEQTEVSPNDVNELLFGDHYPSGIYNIIFTQGAEVKALRVIRR